VAPIGIPGLRTDLVNPQRIASARNRLLAGSRPVPPPALMGRRLKRAFRQQARRWHPDLHGTIPLAEERFKLVNEAYAVAR